MNSNFLGQHLLRACHVNCQSLMAHLDDFWLFFTNSKYDIICFSETWLKPAVLDNIVELLGYQLFRCDRIGKIGGGVACYIANALNYKILKTSDGDYCQKPEFLIAEISSNEEKVLLVVVYRPPLWIFDRSFYHGVWHFCATFKFSVAMDVFLSFRKDTSCERFLQ